MKHRAKDIMPTVTTKELDSRLSFVSGLRYELLSLTPKGDVDHALTLSWVEVILIVQGKICIPKIAEFTTKSKSTLGSTVKNFATDRVSLEK